MFRKMRRSRQELGRQESEAILLRNTAGVLALEGDEGYPYAVPISYVFSQGKLYFHCAKNGHKIDAVRRNPKASFCVIDQNEICEERFTTLFRSAIAFGKIRILTDEAEMHSVMEVLGRKYSPHACDEALEHEIDSTMKSLCVLEMICPARKPLNWSDKDLNNKTRAQACR